MDLLSPGAFLKQLSLGVAFSPDALHLSLLSSHWNRVRQVDVETIDDFQAMLPDQRRHRVQAFLERNRAAHCSVVLSVPRREVLLRQLELPLEARENLAKVVEYQLVNLLPSEERTVATDTLAVREESDPPRLRVTVFVVLQSILERYLESCRELGLCPRPHPARGGGPGRIPEGRGSRSGGGSQPGGQTGPAPGGAGRAGAGSTEALQGIPFRSLRLGGSPGERS